MKQIRDGQEKSGVSVENALYIKKCEIFLYLTDIFIFKNITPIILGTYQIIICTPWNGCTYLLRNDEKGRKIIHHLFVWTYGIQLCGAACNSNLDIIQSKTLRLMLECPWYVTNAAIHIDLEIGTVKKEIERYGEHYEERLRTYPNELATTLLNWNLVVRRLKRSLDLRDYFK